MALKWIGGDFATGAASEQNVLPVTSGSDKVTVDVNAGDTASLSLSKRDLGSNWQDSIAEGVTLVALVDDAQAWNSPAAVLFAGWVDKATGKVGDAIQLEVAGLREYLAARIISPYSNGGTTNQNEGIQFKADTWQGIMASIVSNAFAPLVGSDVQPPTILGNVDGVQAGTAKIRGVRLVDAEDYAKCLDNIRDVLSDVGNEYRLIPRWSDSTKTFIIWDVRIGNETDGKLNWAGTNTNIVLDASTYANLTFSLTRDSKGMANRVIGQSTTGTTGTTGGADYTVVTQANGKPLFDTAFNAGKLLTQAEMQAQLAARIADLKTPKGSATYEVSGNAADWLPLLGSKLSFAGGTDIDSTGYDTVVRLTNLDFSSSDSKIAVTVMLPQSRYPALPSLDKVDNLLGPGSGDNSYGANTPPSGGYRPPNYTPPSYSPWDGLAPPVLPAQIDKNEMSRIATGSEYTSAITSKGQLYSWGYNGNGRLGTGNTTDSLKPVQIGVDTDWTNIYTNGGTSYALKKNNTLWAWGTGNSCQIPDGKGMDVLAPEQVGDSIKSVWGKMGNGGLHVIKNDGTLWGCGVNNAGQLGVGHTVANGIFEKVTNKTDWVKVESSNEGANNVPLHMMALDAAGVIWQWCYKDDSTGNTSPTPTPISAPIGFTDFMVCSNIYQYPNPYQGFYAAAKGTDGKLYTWGNGYHDETGTTTYRHTPALYGGSISDFYGFAYCHTFDARPIGLIMVIKNDGTLWVFGPGGGAADDSIANGCATPLEYGHNTYFDFRKPHFMRTNTRDWYAIVNGKLWAGGQNSYGELGRGDTIATRPLIYQIGTAENWIRVHVTQNQYPSALGVITDSMYGTGRNSSGQLGTEDTTNKSSWTVQPSSSGI